MCAFLWTSSSSRPHTHNLLLQILPLMFPAYGIACFCLSAKMSRSFVLCHSHLACPPPEVMFYIVLCEPAAFQHKIVLPKNAVHWNITVWPLLFFPPKEQSRWQRACPILITWVHRKAASSDFPPRPGQNSVLFDLTQSWPGRRMHLQLSSDFTETRRLQQLAMVQLSQANIVSSYSVPTPSGLQSQLNRLTQKKACIFRFCQFHFIWSDD